MDWLWQRIHGPKVIPLGNLPWFYVPVVFLIKYENYTIDVSDIKEKNDNKHDSYACKNPLLSNNIPDSYFEKRQHLIFQPGSYPVTPDLLPGLEFGVYSYPKSRNMRGKQSLNPIFKAK